MTVDERIAAVSARWILFGAWVIAIAYAYPGYLNWDSGQQLFEARTHNVGDWHPPIMTSYWRVIEIVVRGPFGMLVLQMSLFLGGTYELARRAFTPRVAACMAAAVTLFPPVLTPLAVVWKDAQLAGFLLAGFALATRPTWKARITGCVLLLLAAAVRDNGAAALPPLCLIIVAAWGIRRRIRVVLAGAALCIALAATATVANSLTRVVHRYPWYTSVAPFDLAGTICFADPLSDDDVRSLLPGIELVPSANLQAKICSAYTPRIWFSISGPIFSERPDNAERSARRDAWMHIVRAQPSAFLSHRWTVMKEVLGLSESDLWEPVCQTFAAHPHHLERVHHDASMSRFQELVGDLFRWLARSWLFRPWLYALLSIGALGFAVAKRDQLIVAIAGSGLLYEASLMFGAAAPDYRYSHWMVTCTCISIVCLVTARARKTSSLT